MAGLGKKTFVAGEVLLAQDVNGYLMDQSVMVFGGTAARSSAIPTPTEGMMSYRTDDNVVEVFDGSAYVGVGGGASGGLTLVSATTIGTTVASVTVSNAFSATYDNYKVFVSGGVASANALMGLKLGVTATGYYFGHAAQSYANSGASIGAANGTSWPRIGLASSDTLTANFDLQNPFNAKFTVINYFYNDPRANGEAGAGGGILNNTTSYTDFTITPASGTYTGGTIYVYGYVK